MQSTTIIRVNFYGPLYVLWDVSPPASENHRNFAPKSSRGRISLRKRRNSTAKKIKAEDLHSIDPIDQPLLKFKIWKTTRTKKMKKLDRQLQNVSRKCANDLPSDTSDGSEPYNFALSGRFAPFFCNLLYIVSTFLIFQCTGGIMWIFYGVLHDRCVKFVEENARTFERSYTYWRRW